MKKNNLTGQHLTEKVPIKHFLLIMRTTLILLFICVFYSMAETGHSQNARVTIDAQNTSFKDILNEIEKQTDYLFIYDNQVDVNRTMTVRIKKQTVAYLLNSILKNTNLIYQMEGNHIILKTDNSIEDQSGLTQENRKNLTGKVSDQSGLPVIGANIIEQGTTNGTVTDINGDFSLSVDRNAIIQISYIGYLEQEINTSGREKLNIILTEDTKTLDEVVVTALGIKREIKALGYAMQEVDGEELSGGHGINAMDGLTGRIAGVDLSTTTAGPSGSTRIIIRGNSELSGDNQPLYVIDGIPMDNTQLGSAGKWGGYDMGDGLSSINPQDIESISILKGPSASALYGSRAAHGVILITTKTATQKGLGIEFNSSLNVVTLASQFDDYQREYGHGRNGELPLTFEEGRGVSQSAWGARLDPNLNTYIYNGQQKPYANVENNILSFFREGVTVNNSLSLTSVSDKASVRLSVSDMRNNDIVPKSDMNRSSFMLKADGKLSEKLRIESRVNYTIENVNNRPALSDNPNNIGLSLIGLAPSFNQKWLSEGYKNDYGEYVDWNGGNIYRINPYWSINEMNNVSKKERVMGYIQANYELTKGLNFQLRGGTDFYKFRITEFSAAHTPVFPTGAMSESSADVSETNLEGLLTYSTKISENFDFTGLIGGNLMHYNYERFTNTGEDEVVPGMKYIGNYNLKSLMYENPRKQIRSLYGAVNLGYKSMLYLDMTLRNDWSSTLNRGNNSYMYPSVSSSFVFSNLYDLNGLLSFGKLRASWAEVGGDTRPYMLNLNYGLLNYNFNELPLGQVSSGSIPNLNLKPTRTYSYEFGLDLRFLNNRLNLDISHYNQKTRDQILDLSISNTSGFSTAIVNSGEISNRGIELSINATPLETKDFSWNIIVNYARNVNKVVELHPELDAFVLAEARWAGALIQAKEGEPYGAIMGAAFERDPDGNVIYNNGLPVVGSDYKVLGHGVHDWTGGVGNFITYKGFRLGALFDVKWGASLYSMSSITAHANGISKETLEGRKEWYESEELRKQANLEPTEWTPTGGFIGKGVVLNEDGSYSPNTTPVDPQDYWTSMLNSNTPEPFIYDASFIKLRELTLSYSLNKRLIATTPFTDVSFSLFGRNLWTFYSKTPNIDPESNYNNGNGQGFEYGSLPSRRTYGFSVSVKL
jgi:TonB-linked SusC/RagA family outer membrane protein